MNRTLAALSIALEALVAVAIGLAVVLVPLTALWAGHFQFTVPWSVFWHAGAAIWLLGNGVDLTVALDPAALTALGLPGGAATFTLSLAPLGLGLITAGLGFRVGRRAARAGEAVLALAVTAATGLVAGALVTLGSGGGPVRPSAWQGVVLPATVLVLGVALGLAWQYAADGGALRWPRQASERVRAGIAAALRAGTGAAMLLLAASALLVAILLVTRFARVVGLYEGLHSGVLGGSVLTVAQAALLPNAVIAAGSWLLGPGFALGVGSSVGPTGTQLGPVPGLPLLGILPQGDVALGLLGLVVPLVCGFVAGAFVRRRAPHLAPLDAAATALGVGVVAGAQWGVLAWWCAGAAGPGRLAQVGPDPWAVGAAAALVVTVGALAGVSVRRGTRGAAGTGPSFLSGIADARARIHR